MTLSIFWLDSSYDLFPPLSSSQNGEGATAEPVPETSLSQGLFDVGLGALDLESQDPGFEWWL